jgi:carboxypeptidase C (cathepsin A)
LDRFITVRGAGHMVPEFRPLEAAEMMRRWLASEPLQPYVPATHG